MIETVCLCSSQNQPKKIRVNPTVIQEVLPVKTLPEHHRYKGFGFSAKKGQIG